MKVFLSVLAIGVALFSGGLAIRNNQLAETAKIELNQERYQRMTAEEQLNNANNKIASLESDVAKVAKKLKANEALIDQMKTINGELVAKLDKAKEIKENLEQKGSLGIIM